LLWLAVVPTVIIVFVTAWGRAIAAAIGDRPVQTAHLPRWVLDPRVVNIFGVIVPGLGLMISGHPRRAAWAFWILGPMGAAAAILAHRQWLWGRSLSATPPGISGATLEVVFVAAVGVAALALLVWIFQALDGARRVSTHRSHAFADAISVALLIVLVLFAATFRPVPLARNLHAAATTLRLDGYRLIPLGLCEAAVRLDPVNPLYLAQAAELYETTGMKDAAVAKRRVLERRSKEYLEVLRKDIDAATPAFVFSSLVHHPIDMENHLAASNEQTWSQIKALYR
jgi:hypothetical protein